MCIRDSYNQDNELIVNEGELIIFPAQIIHGYNDNKFQDRVTLSMNMMPTIVTNGDYGWRCVNLNKAEREKAFDTKENLDLTKEKYNAIIEYGKQNDLSYHFCFSHPIIILWID